MSKTQTNTEFKLPSNLDEFRQDVINNVEFKKFKDKYGIKTHIDLDGYLHRLSRLDKKIYEYKYSEVVRGLPVYEAKDKFIKISPKEVDKIKSVLKCSSILCENLTFDGKNKVSFEVKAA